MHVIINILFYCKLRNIYGLKWTTTSKRSSPPRGREWKICLNMKVVKWVAAHTGMFIKRSVKTGKTRDWLTRFCCHWCWINLDRVWLFLFSWTRFSGPPPNQRDVHCLCRSSRAYISLHAAVHVFMSAGVSLLRCSAVHVFRNPAGVQMLSARAVLLVCAEVHILLKQEFINACLCVQKFIQHVHVCRSSNVHQCECSFMHQLCRSHVCVCRSH